MSARTVALFSAASMTALGWVGQVPGDRPAPNPRATRSVVLARNGMIATSQPLASAAGLAVLQAGGNASDAAVTAAAVLAVVEPTMNGIGGDLFAMVFDPRTRRLEGLNASGRSPAAATPEAFARRGLTSVPSDGILSVSVPGVVDGWAELLARHGTLTLAQALAPAIRYARDGFPVSEIIAHQWASGAGALAADPETAATYLLNGRAPVTGEVFAVPRLAASLERIAADGRDAFYRGDLARAIAADARRRDGLLDLDDLRGHRPDWIEPIGTTYRGYDIFELPPNTQGIAVLEMLNILEGYDLRSLGHNSADYLHLLVEAKRIAWADRDTYIADPDSVPPDVLRTLVSKEYAARRRTEITRDRAAESYAPGLNTRPSAGIGGGEGIDTGDTIYLTAADGRGQVVSLIQSLFSTFGAGIVAGDTGILLHNRGSLFTLREGHPNRIAPRKRPFHTLVPAMVMKDGRPWLSFGVMGGDMQPQGHVQVIANLIDFGMNVQEAGEAARFRHAGMAVSLESGIPMDVRSALAARGHRLRTVRGIYGGFQGILIDPATGVLMGGSDPRKDGLAIGY
jgi:gamma-glutamyltranspeptidase/glutathione hydrolase